MFENLQIFRMAQAMAVHAGKRQAVISANIANADTPGFAAKDVAPFHTLVDEGPGQASQGMRATRVGHLNATDPARPLEVAMREGEEADPNGNTVSLETEMIHAVDTKRQHDRALAIYRSSLNILRMSIGRR